MPSLDILGVFRLDLGQISFNLVENAFATRQLAFLATSIAFYNILARAYAEIKISIRPITLIWASLERSFAPAEVEYR